MSMSLDGKIANHDRSITSFGSPRDLENLYRLRATADAILCGARTIEESNATLGNGGPKMTQRRLRRGLSEYPLRVIVSGNASISPKSKIFVESFSPIVLLTTRRAPAKKLRQLESLVDCVRQENQSEIHWPEALSWLRSVFGIKRLLCEGGGELNDSLFRAGVVDEVHLTICPLILGGRSAPTLSEGQGVDQLANAYQLQWVRTQRIGNELFCVLHRRK